MVGAALHRRARRCPALKSKGVEFIDEGEDFDNVTVATLQGPRRQLRPAGAVPVVGASGARPVKCGAQRVRHVDVLAQQARALRR